MNNIGKLILTFVLSTSLGSALSAQNLVKVSGLVTSADDGLPMMGAAVMAGPGNGVITDLDGVLEHRIR